MGELHLEVLVERMFREFSVAANVGRPEVAYRETITGAAEAEGKFIKQTGGHGQYGHVIMSFEPLPPGTGFVFENKVIGGRVPREYVPAVEKGIAEAMENGVLAGYPMVDFRAIAAGRVLARRGLQRNGLQGRGIDGIQVGLCKSQTDYP